MLTVAGVASVRAALRAAMAHESGADTQVEWRMPTRLQGEEFVTAALRHRVAEPLVMHAEVLDLPDDVWTSLIAERDRNYVGSLAVARHMYDAQCALTEGGIRSLAFKGPALAMQSIGDFRARGGGDVDLLVAPGDVGKAIDCLTDNGWSLGKKLPVRESWAWRHVLRTHYEVSLVRGGITVDLHWRLTPAPGALPELDEAWTSRAHVDLGGLPVTTLGVTDALKHTCGHAEKDDWAWLRSLIDIHRLARTSEGIAYLQSRSTRVDRRSLAVAVASLGPVNSVATPLARHRHLHLAQSYQDGPIVAEPIFPLHIGIPRQVRRLTRGGHPIGASHVALRRIALPMRVVTETTAADWSTALPQVLAARVRDIPPRMSQRCRQRSPVRR